VSGPFQPQSGRSCPECGGGIAPGVLACPACHRLVHDERLRAIQHEASAASESGDLSDELRLWREALALIPAGTRQHETIAARIATLSDRVDQESEHTRHSGAWKKSAGPLGALALILWKFKTIVLLALTKGKLLLFGLTKFSTLSTMLVSVGAYWTQFGWRFAVGLVLSIYVHEMGHVYALRRFGIAASAPMFIPFVGAFVRMNQHPASVREDARVGLAGPIWGTAAAIALFAFWAGTGIPVIGGIAHFAAWLNLFNLIPVWQLDGARGMRALSRAQRAILLAVMLGTWVLTREGFLIVLAVLTAFRLFTRDWPDEGDDKALSQFCALILILGVLLAVPLGQP
jgi:Zn-dependent protease